MGCAKKPLPPQEVFLYAELDESAKQALQSALTEFNAQHPAILAALVDRNASSIDLVLGPLLSEGIPWRSLGWRLWSRLETLAILEGAYNRPLIRQLREAALEGQGFLQLAEDMKARDLPVFVVPVSPDTYALALELYLSALAGGDQGEYQRWLTRGWIRETSDLSDALDLLAGGHAAFLLGNDQLGERLGQSWDNHPEGFPLPGGSGENRRLVLGRAEGFSLPPGQTVKSGTYELLTWLTSKGLAQEFSKTLRGTFYFWNEAPPEGQLPVVDGPTEFLSTEGW